MPDRAAPLFGVYYFYGPGDELLYIGRSRYVFQRLSEHAFDKPWFRTVVKITITHCNNNADAIALEASEIKSKRPRYNTITSETSSKRRSL